MRSESDNECLQIDYIVSNGWTPCLEFSDADQAYVKSTNVERFNNMSPGYYDNRYTPAMLFACDVAFLSFARQWAARTLWRLCSIASIVIKPAILNIRLLLFNPKVNKHCLHICIERYNKILSCLLQLMRNLALLLQKFLELVLLVYPTELA